MRPLLVLTLAATLLLVPQARADSTAWQGDATRAGNVTVPGLTPPLVRAWSTPIRGGLSSAVVAGGSVFVVVPAAPSADGYAHGVELVALDPATGAERWRRSIAGRYGSGDVAVVGDHLSVTIGDGKVSAFGFDGTPRWTYVPAQEEVEVAPPADFMGKTLTTSQAGDGDLIAVDAGSRAWAAVTTGADAVPAVAGDTAYHALSCGEVVAVRPDGSRRFRHAGTCSGPGQAVSVAGGRVWATSSTDPGQVLDAATGALIRPLTSSPGRFPPAVGGGMAIYPTCLQNAPDTPIRAERADDGTVAWTLSAPPQDLWLPPLIVNDVVYVLLGDTLSARDVHDGHVLQQLPSARATDGVSLSHHQGLAAGAGLLLVPEGPYLTAYRSATPAATAGPPTATTTPVTTTTSPSAAGRQRVGVARAISRRALRRRGLRVTVRRTARTRSVRAVLRAGRRTVAARAARPRGRGTVVLRLRARRVPRSTSRLRLLVTVDGQRVAARGVRLRRGG